MYFMYSYLCILYMLCILCIYVLCMLFMVFWVGLRRLSSRPEVAVVLNGLDDLVRDHPRGVVLEKAHAGSDEVVPELLAKLGCRKAVELLLKVLESVHHVIKRDLITDALVKAHRKIIN